MELGLGYINSFIINIIIYYIIIFYFLLLLLIIFFLLLLLLLLSSSACAVSNFLLYPVLLQAQPPWSAQTHFSSRPPYTVSMGQVLSVYFGSRNRTLASLAAVLLSYYLKRRYGKFASLLSVVLYLSGMLQYRKYLINGGIVRRQTMGPLKDIVVLDLSNGISGPACGTILGDLGAQVINVESVALPDHARFLGAAVSTGMSGLFAHTGRGKQSILLDLLSQEAKIF